MHILVFKTIDSSRVRAPSLRRRTDVIKIFPLDTRETGNFLLCLSKFQAKMDSIQQVIDRLSLPKINSTEKFRSIVDAIVEFLENGPKDIPTLHKARRHAEFCRRTHYKVPKSSKRKKCRFRRKPPCKNKCRTYGKFFSKNLPKSNDFEVVAA